jgi:aryl-alcohol dehydrogenase-like predicted oxidoreductase
LEENFTHTTLGKTGLKAFRLGLSASYWPGEKTVYKAIDEGINFFFLFHWDLQMVKVLRDVLKTRRANLIVATGAYNFVIGHLNLRKSLEKRLRQLKIDCIDVFLYLGVLKEKELSDYILEEFQRFRQEGKIRSFGISTHHRKLAGGLAEKGKLDVLMIRYNAAHRGAEQDIFPYLQHHKPGIVGYTATCWRYLVRRPKGWPKNGRIPTAGMCYRFVLSNPHVHVCLTAPTNIKQFNKNIAAVRKGPLDQEDMEFMCKFGDAVHRTSHTGFGRIIPFSKSKD